MKMWRIAAPALAWVFMGGCNLPDGPLSQDERLAELNWIISKFEHNYAPLQYKQNLHGFDWLALKAEYQAKVSEEMSNEQLRVVLSEFVNVFKDAHTSLMADYNIMPGSLTVAYFGFLGERVFEDNLDKLLVTDILPSYQMMPGAFPIKTGDLITHIGGKGLFEVVRELCPRDLGQDESNKTALLPYLGVIPNLNCALPEEGFISVGFERDGQSLEVDLPWVQQDYFAFVEDQMLAQQQIDHEQCGDEVAEPEPMPAMKSRHKSLHIFDYMKNRLRDFAANPRITGQFTAQYLPHSLFTNPVKQLKSCGDSDQVSSYLQNDDTVDGIPLSEFFDYSVHERESGKVGYVKIDTFMPSFALETTVEAFRKILAFFVAQEAKAVVIDLSHNGGGSLEYGLRLVDVIKNTGRQEAVLTARLNDNWLNDLRGMSLFGPNQSAKTVARFRYQNMKASQEAGQVLSDPFKFSEFMFLPRGYPDYQLPLVLMVDEMCASMCDIFSADLKDNGLAKLIGKQTMGAGGNVTQHALSPRMNLLLSQTESLIIRPSGEYIENKGILVDRAYERTAADIVGQNSGFIAAAVDYALELYP